MGINVKHGKTAEEAAARLMGVEDVKPEVNAGVNTNANNSNSKPVMSLGFTGYGIQMLSDGLGSEYTNKWKAVLEKIYNSEPLSQSMTKVLVLDKEVVSANIQFSSVIVSVKRNNTVAFYIMLLEATGRKPQKAAEIMEQLKDIQRGAKVKIWTSNDSLDNIYFQEIRRVLQASYPAGTKFINVDGTVIPYTFSEITEELVRPIAATGFNAGYLELLKINKEFADINIAEAAKNDQNTVLKLEPSFVRTTINNKVLNPIRLDFNVALNAVSNRMDYTSPNAEPVKEIVSSVGGFVDTIPRIISTQLPGTLTPIEETRFAPHIIIDTIDNKLPTFGFTFLSIITSLYMLQEPLWKTALTPNGDDKLHNVGMLNILANIEKNPKGGKPIDLFDTKLSLKDVHAAISKMYTLQPYFSVDVELYGPETVATSIIAAAASAGLTAEEQKVRQEARQEIIDVCRWLTNYNFPENFDINTIFQYEGVLVPLGKFVDRNNKVRDIRDIDLAFIANYTNGNLDLMDKWVVSNLPMSLSGLDPFLLKTEVIAAIAPEAEITGKALRVRFTDTFTATLTTAAMNAGLSMLKDPTFDVTSSASLETVSQYFDNGINPNIINGLFRNQSTGPGYATPYTVAGAYRYF